MKGDVLRGRSLTHGWLWELGLGTSAPILWMCLQTVWNTFVNAASFWLFPANTFSFFNFPGFGHVWGRCGVTWLIYDCLTMQIELGGECSLKVCWTLHCSIEVEFSGESNSVLPFGNAQLELVPMQKSTVVWMMQHMSTVGNAVDNMWNVKSKCAKQKADMNSGFTERSAIRLVNYFTPLNGPNLHRKPSMSFSS